MIMCYHPWILEEEVDKELWCDGRKARCDGCTCRYPTVNLFQEMCTTCKKPVYFFFDLMWEEGQKLFREYDYATNTWSLQKFADVTEKIFIAVFKVLHTLDAIERMSRSEWEKQIVFLAKQLSTLRINYEIAQEYNADVDQGSDSDVDSGIEIES